MLRPSQVQFYAKKAENKNYRFRSWLKMHADPADQETGSYNTKHTPCDFLDDQRDCILGDCVPQNCLDYPYTDRPDRMESLLSFLEAVAVCPVAYEICERLKGHYGFQ